MSEGQVVVDPEAYNAGLELIKDRILQSRQRAVIAANAHMLYLYWEIGHYIAERQRLAGWGAKVISNLSKDIRSTMPEATGFSVRNLKYMVKFAEVYPVDAIVQPVAAQLDSESGQPLVASANKEEEVSIVQGVPELFTDESIVQPVAALENEGIMTYFFNSQIAQVGWTHHMLLIDKVKSPKERNYYIQRTISEGWSRRVLTHKIKEGLYESQGSLPNNFDLTLPHPQSELAKATLKDPYLFEFLTIRTAAKEREVE